MTKWSQVSPNSSPALVDYLMGVTSGNVDFRVTVQNLVNLIMKNTLINNPYKFYCYRTAAQAVVNGTNTLVQFDTKVYDTSSNVDVVTNKGRFTAPVSGFYDLQSIVAGATASGGFVILTMYKNGAAILQGNKLYIGTATGASAGIAATLQLSAGDYIELYVYITGTALEIGTAPPSCWFQGKLSSST